MAKLIRGERVGKLGKLVASTCATISDPTRQKILIRRRSDNNRLCLPGRGMDAGESASEACAREVLEETGLVVSVGRLIGVYSSPDLLIEYADGNRVQGVTLGFEATEIGGVLALTPETTGFGYFSTKEMLPMDLMEDERIRISDAFEEIATTFVR